MIVEEIKDGTVLHYSDGGKYIKRDDSDLLFLSAEDVYPCPYEYEETEEIPTDNIDSDEAVFIMLGGVTE